MIKNSNEQNKITLMSAICKIVKKERLKQKEIAKLLDIKQPRVSDLISLKHEKFSIDILINYMEAFGYSIIFKALDKEKGNPIKAYVEKNTSEYKKILNT